MMERNTPGNIPAELIAIFEGEDWPVSEERDTRQCGIRLLLLLEVHKPNS
jgi:hypothetical protein